ncbi:MAG: dihydropteroate synthase [Saprospiraceae bacterium]
MKSINVGGQLLVFDKPKIMGIVNITPDSFYAESRKIHAEEVCQIVASMLQDGASIIDLGAFSSRPGAEMLSVTEELDRLMPIVSALRDAFPELILSIDTYRTAVMKEVLKTGSFIINDITAWSQDPELPDFAAKYKLPYILMHMKGMPDTMKSQAEYNDVVFEVLDFLAIKLDCLKKAGVNDVIIDPGFGFAKTIEHNFQLLSRLSAFSIFDAGLLVGISRKSMIYKTLGTTASEALNGSSALHMVALQNGAQILRVHDVKEAKEVIELHEALKASVK